MPDAKPRRSLKKRCVLALILGLTCMGLHLALSRSQWIEDHFATSWAPSVSAGLTALTGRLPFCLAEWLLGAALIFVASRTFSILRAAWRREGRAVLVALVDLLNFALLTALLFYATWGLHYGQRPLALRLDWAPPLEASVQDDELERLAGELVDEVNRLYRGLHGGDDRERPSHEGDGPDADALESKLDDGLRAAGRVLGLPDPFARSRGPSKTPLASGLMTRLALSGFYFPWTGEANVNGQIPHWQAPFVRAHEKAHQRGIASEDEANYLAVLACHFVDDAFVRYSGLLSAQRYLLFDLLRLRPEAAQKLIARRIPGVQRDVLAARQFWTRNESWSSEVSRSVNDRYLKAHQVIGGIASYGRVSRLLLRGPSRTNGYFCAE